MTLPQLSITYISNNTIKKHHINYKNRKEKQQKVPSKNVGSTYTFFCSEESYSTLMPIYRRFSRHVQLGGLVPVLVLGVPPRYKAK